jgi:Arc/MetJ-type ribon-helix-helix transcriptional regulator
MINYMINTHKERSMPSPKSSKAKPATISLPSDLLAVIDKYVNEHKSDGVTRSSVVEEGVRLWLQTVRDRRDLEYFTKNAKALQADNESWSAIASEAAKEIFK